MYWSHDSKGKSIFGSQIVDSFRHSKDIPLEKSKIKALRDFGIVAIDGISIQYNTEYNVPVAQ